MSDITIRPDDIGTPDVSIKVNVAGGMDGVGIEDITISGGDEIDDDGPGSGGDSSEVVSNILSDTETGVRYRLYVVNGSLSMEEVSDAMAVSAAPAGDGLRLVDDATGATYKVFVSGGKLTMTEVE